ncbi:autotransporter-associated beta strand repeat [Hoeflea sp. IMCC20628]|nr:autotransporter-associated beta strand repeat [Hoeflea sp. IMCC20628]
MTLTGVNTYTGTTTVSAGTFALTGVGALASTDIDISNGGTLQTDGSALADGSDIDIAAGGTLDIDGSENLGATSTLDLNGAGALVDIAAGQTLSVGTITTADGSTVTINAGATLAGLGNTINNGGVMNVADTGSVTDAGAINNLVTGVYNFAGAATFDSDSDNAGAEQITNDGQINLNGNNTQIVNIGPNGNNDLLNQNAGQVELLSNLVFEACRSCGDLVGVCSFNSVFERDACDDFGQVIKAA